MKLEIINEIKNPLFDRTEVQAKINNLIVPSYDEVGKLMSEKYKVEIDAIKIKTVKGKFGSNDFEVIANVYPSVEAKNKVEVKTKQEVAAEKKAEEDRVNAEADAKKAKEEEKAAAEAAKAEAEKPAEEATAESTETVEATA